ncbi:Pleckstrin-likey domain-containing protein [Metschnikowia aff. pulcherrima]|uniref:Pleckstrin-likey domain-containing protein n=1 Tax=Metschnikowia aff. pulcherrima TaxID=2163413 RepID=A0A4P6XNN3_9ASCO|nr:Pleckstrin-likey domain-containing protein [Metschnikowia aff. pulcherrima]
MSEHNRSLRRKPPPSISTYTNGTTTSRMQKEPELPSVPILTPEKQVCTSPYGRLRTLPQLTVDADLSYDSNYGHEYDEYADFASYAEDLLLSYESPRLKGPQNLTFDEMGRDLPPELDYYAITQSEPPSPLFLRQNDDFLAPLAEEPSPPATHQKHSPLSLLSHRIRSYRERKFQNLLQKGTLPFQVLESEDDSYFAKSLPRAQHDVAERAYRGTQTPLPPPQLPYPLSDKYSSDEDAEDFMNGISNGANDWRTQPQAPAMTTPTRIPSLAEKNAMRIPGRLLHKSSSLDLRFVRNSPPRLMHLPSTSPELQQFNYFSSPLSSPTRVSLYGRLPQMHSGAVSDSRSSRSPSPKKFAASSNVKSGVYPYDEDYLNVFEDYYNQERVPRWSLIEKDEFEYYDDSFFMPPEANQFDYTILPELPKLDDDLEQSISALTPSREGTPQLQPTLTIRRKNDDLPPVPLELPPLPFLPSALTSLHFAACAHVWSLRSVFEWCLQLNGWTHGHKFSLKEFRKVLMRLVAFHKQDIPIDLISRNVAHIIDSLTQHELIIFVDNPEANESKALVFVFKEDGIISGVLVDLTSCYCRDEDHKLTGLENYSLKCYSSQCLINKTIEHENLMKTTNIKELVLGDDWASHWKLAAQDMAVDLSESRRQSYLFDLIKFEQNFIQRAECFIDVAGPEFIKLAKLMVGLNSLTMKEFEEKILGSARELLAIHRDSLYEPLLNILVTDGKFIKDLNGMASLYKAWATAAKDPLLIYISVMPMIEDLLENTALKRWDELIRLNTRMKELQVNGNLLLMSTFNSRYQQLPLQLLDVRKFFDEEDEEFVSLTSAVDAIRRLGAKVNQMKVFSDNVHALKLVEKQLVWKLNVFQPRLNLKSSRRKFFFRGDLVRKGDLKINSHSAHLIVLDNFILLTEKQRAQRMATYKVTETPIPLDYLIVENREKESSGLLNGLSAKPSVISSNMMNGEIDEESSSFPFKIRYAGRGKSESHTLVAASEKERKKWISVLIQAKSNLLKRVLPLTPYGFELVENKFFAYDHNSRMSKLPILCAADPLSILAKETSSLADNSLNATLIQRQVLSSETFRFASGEFVFLGTNSGVYCSDKRNRWKKIINMNNVTKVTAVPEFNVVLVLAGKSLRYYPLQLLINIYYEKKDKITSYLLSNEGILFYEFGRHRGLPTLFVAKKKTTGTTSFKVYILELDNNGIFSMFTVTRRFSIQAECHGISVFNSSIAVHTQRGFEVLDLQKLSPRSVPELPASEQSSKKLDGYSKKKVVQSTDVLKKLISHAVPMGMFKLANNREFLMVYNECAIFANKSGKLSRTEAIRFDFKPKNIAFLDNNLFLICEEVIEVWSISSEANGTNKLIQVIPSKGLQVLDPLELYFKLANPNNADLQLIFKMKIKSEKFLVKEKE